MSKISNDGLRILKYFININETKSYLVFKLWFNRDFNIHLIGGNRTISINFLSHSKKLVLQRDIVKKSEITLPNSLNSNFVVMWITAKAPGVIKVSISNISAKLSLNDSLTLNGGMLSFKTEDGLIKKLVYSKNFYDFDSEQYHRIMLQEKLNGSYIE